MRMDRFDTCLSFTLGWERDRRDPTPRLDAVGPDVTDHPADPGGLTNDGVTQALFDEFLASKGLGTRSVRTMTPFERNAIYRGRWDAVRGDYLGPGADLAVFDYAVNSGPRQAVKDLQRAVSELGGAAVVDGVFGPKTLAAVAGLQAPLSLGMAVCRRRRKLIEKIVAARPELAVFRAGWERRISAVEKAVREIALDSQAMSVAKGTREGWIK